MKLKSLIHLSPIVAPVIVITSAFTLNCNSVIAREVYLDEVRADSEYNSTILFTPSNSDSSQILLAQQKDPIDLEPLRAYFNISNLREIKREYTNTLGHVYYRPALAFTVEAKRSFSLQLFHVNFYDSEMIKVAPTRIVDFEPQYGEWEPGMRSRAYINLPSDMSRVTLIKVTPLF